MTLLDDAPSWLFKANAQMVNQLFDREREYDERELERFLLNCLHPSKYIELIGDATNPIEVGKDERRVIVHCCNDQGAWGAGFVLALTAKWPKVEAYYRDWHKNGDKMHAFPFELGNYQLVDTDGKGNLYVCNLIGQTLGYEKGVPPIRYEAIQKGLQDLADCLAMDGRKWSVHMPKMGAGLAGGDWNIIKGMVHEILVKRGIPVVVYTLED